MNKKKLFYGLIFFVALSGAFFTTAQKAHASSGKVYNFTSRGSAAENRRALNRLMDGNEKKTINIKSDIRIDTYLRPGSNTMINAGKHTIVSGNGVILNDPTRASYGNLRNLTINGGIWKNTSSSGLKGTMMRIAYAENVQINGAKVSSNYQGHSIELIACKNVSVTGCVLKAKGHCPKRCVEEQLQIDLATPRTAPGLSRLHRGLCKGKPCKNIKVVNCRISGARGICANFAASESRYRKARNYHSNLQVINCKVTGKSAEAVALFNTKSATVKGCRITTKAPTRRGAYSDGLAIVYQRGSSPKSRTKNKVTVTGNVVKGGREGIFIYSHTSKKFGKVVVKDNKAYARSGKKNAVKLNAGGRKCAKKVKASGNKKKKW